MDISTDYSIIEMSLDRYDQLMNLWKSTEGLWISDDDDYDNLKRFLDRNPGLSLVALREGCVIGTIKCGHDGRRGYLHHLAVAENYRGQGLGRDLVGRCIKNLRQQGIKKIRVFVSDSNEKGQRFWTHIGFNEQTYDYRTFDLNE